MSVQNQFITFTYPSGPKDVIVTGDFCKWKKVTHLVPQSDGSFSLTMPLVHKAIKKEKTGDYFYFKYIVDDKWTIDPRFESKVPENASVNQPNNYVKIDENSKRLSSFIPESVLPMIPGNTTPTSTTPSKKRVRVKRKVKKNKKTGETIVVSEEQEFVNENEEDAYTTATTSTTASPDLYEERAHVANSIVIPTTAEAKEAFTKFEPSANNDKEEETKEKKINTEEPTFHIQPVEQPATSLSVAGEPGVQIADPTNPVFTEIRTIDPKELNHRLNEDLAKEEEAEEPTFHIQPVEQPATSLSLKGEPGVQIADPSNPVFTEIRTMDPKEVNDRLNADLLKEKEAEGKEINAAYVEEHIKVSKPNGEVTIQPVNPESEVGKNPSSLAGEPGVQLPDIKNPVFTEFSNVDQKELSDKLNAQLAEEQKEAEKEQTEVAETAEDVPAVPAVATAAPVAITEDVETPIAETKVPEPKKVVEPAATPVVKQKPVEAVAKPAPTKKSDGGCCVIC